MAGIEEFNFEQNAHNLTMAILHRMQQAGIPEEEAHTNANILFEFAKIAGTLIQQNKAIPIPGTEQNLPFDETMALQTMELFVEGVYFTMTKCREFAIPDDLRPNFLQQAAQHIFEQTQQVVISTFGQENTPELPQIAMDQQVQIVNQTAESALLYYISEYEKVNGPIAIDEETVARLTESGNMNELMEEALDTAEAEVPDGLPEPMPAPAPVAAKRGPSPHDKYAALALLLPALPQRQQEHLTARLSPDEMVLINQYSDPAAIARNLDLASVNSILKAFKAQLAQRSGDPRGPRYVRHFEELFAEHSKDTLSTHLRYERPQIHHYLANYGTYGSRVETSGDNENALPPRIEQALFQFLSKKVS